MAEGGKDVSCWFTCNTPRTQGSSEFTSMHMRTLARASQVIGVSLAASIVGRLNTTISSSSSGKPAKRFALYATVCTLIWRALKTISLKMLLSKQLRDKSCELLGINLLVRGGEYRKKLTWKSTVDDTSAGLSVKLRVSAGIAWANVKGSIWSLPLLLKIHTSVKLAQGLSYHIVRILGWPCQAARWGTSMALKRAALMLLH